jgi:suppressor of G2 allele of SKP1
MSAAARGQTAFANGDYLTAIEHLTIALKEQQSPLWLIQRSTAYQRTKQYELALADADNATLIAIQRARREQIATAQFRRAIALHALGRFGDARLCLNWCHKKNEKEKGLTMWIAKVKKDYDAAGGDEAECNKTTVKEVPEKAGVIGSETKKSDTKENVKPASSTTSAAVPKALTATPKEKIRHEWYQSPSTVTIEVFAKGVPKDKAEVVIEEGNVSCFGSCLSGC